MFFCDVCYVDDLGIKDFFATQTKHNYSRHIKTSKHIKNLEIVSKLETNIKCNECSGYFTADGWEVHESRNKSLWEMQKTGHSIIKTMTCNKFNVGSKYYCSVDDYKNSLKTKDIIIKRTRVGQVSPVTNVLRTHNKKVVDNDDELEELEELEDISYISTKTPSTQMKDWEYAIFDGPKPDIEQWDVCMYCSEIINEGAIPLSVLKKWDITVCGCETESDSDSDSADDCM
tara:strand:- start:1027 stop:1716 length:690 start_codon:yes stop_codon:yes gene_type:complete